MALGQAANRPNVILIATDDLNTWIEPLGSAMARTPNLDRLATQGVTFTNAHTAGIYCAPSRSAIFTGRYASTTGCYSAELYFYDHPEYRPLQQAFKQGGYQTYGTGKLFHHPAGYLDQRGWSEFFV
ncbi:MAG: sulfatase-like hydrolase/transferase, partial [Planctomycetes bacterium]|nr:sulfatase-like hydrolase/transferase [Planctomycetota bacterium]